MKNVLLLVTVLSLSASAHGESLKFTCETTAVVRPSYKMTVHGSLDDQNRPVDVYILNTQSQRLETFRNDPTPSRFDENDSLARDFARFDVSGGPAGEDVYFFNLPKVLAHAPGAVFEATVDIYFNGGRYGWYRFEQSCRTGE